MRYFLPAILLAGFLGSLLGLSKTQSFLSDEEKMSNNVLSTAAVFATGTPTPSPSASPSPSSPPITQVLVINEVLPDTSCSVGQTEAQWIEVYNGYSTTIDLKDYELTDGTNTIDLVQAANTNVPSGGFALIAHNSAVWNQCYDDNGVTTANFGGQFDIDTGTLQLKDPDGVVIDTVQWDGSTGLNPAQNESIERDPDGAADFVVRSTPQPGL